MKGASDVKHALSFVRDAMPPAAPKTRAAAEASSKERHSCEPLLTQFRRDGFHYRQIHRKGDFAIYQQIWEANKDSAAFEVIRIKRRDGFEIGGRFVEPAEVYPNCEAWGVHGFTFTDRDAAFVKLREICR